MGCSGSTEKLQRAEEERRRQVEDEYGLILPAETFVPPPSAHPRVSIVLEMDGIESNQFIPLEDPAVLIKLRLYENTPPAFTGLIPPPCAIQLLFSGVEVGNLEPLAACGVVEGARLEIQVSAPRRLQVAFPTGLAEHEQHSLNEVSAWPEEPLKSLLCRLARTQTQEPPPLQGRWYANSLDSPVSLVTSIGSVLQDGDRLFCGVEARVVLTERGSKFTDLQYMTLAPEPAANETLTVWKHMGNKQHGTIDQGMVVVGEMLQVNKRRYLDLGTGAVPTGGGKVNNVGQQHLGMRKLLPAKWLEFIPRG